MSKTKSALLRIKKIRKFKVFIFMLVFSLLSGVFSVGQNVSAEKKSLKVLAIGNSFSENAFQYLYPIAESAGYDEIKLGNLYIAGCNLQTHWNNAKNNSKSYAYNKNYDGTWQNNPNTSILTALTSEEWDYIILQQVSTHSGMEESFEPYLENLIEYVNENKTNPDAKLAWHMTWAYAQSSTHAGFVNYDKSQQKMYDSILNAVKVGIIDKYSDEISIIIPSGTSIQNMRTSFIADDDMTSDGYHLSQRLGCYVASLTWFKSLTGENIDKINTNVISDIYQDVAKEAVNAAIKTPYEVTNSSFETEPKIEFEPDEYELFNWEPLPFSYWNSTSTMNCYTAPTVELNQRFIASTKRLTKEDIPVGSVIVVEKGYQYRAEKWPVEGLVTTTREPNTDEGIVFVTESWWSDWAYVTFNFSKKDNTKISEDAENHSQFLKIYIPKEGKNKYTGDVEKPVLEEKTENSITLKKLDGYEYSLDGETWQESNVFADLNAGMEYNFYCRIAETDTTLASEQSEKVTISTLEDENSSNPDKTKTDGDGILKKILIGGGAIALIGISVGLTWWLKQRKSK